jgi:hypothetical protein
MSARTVQLGLATLVAPVLLVACSINVDKRDGDDQANVDIRTPFGNLSVRAGGEVPDTGLPVYEGARPLRDGGEHPENADVSISSPFFGVEVAAAKFEHDAAPEEILAFYGNELKAYGEVTECRGNIDFDRWSDSRPECRERPRSNEIQLAAGTEHEHHIVSVKPRGDGSEFALVYVQTRGRD